MSSPILKSPSSFIAALPKAELHLHLEGSVEAPTLLEIRKSHGEDFTLEEVSHLYHYTDFKGFLMAFKAITEDLQTPADYEYITYRLMQKLRRENVLHAEVYVSVGVCLWRKQDFAAIFEGLERGRRRGEKDFGVSLLWIFDAVRQFGLEAAERVFELAALYHDRNVVGIGIGGDELKGPPELFREAYEKASGRGLRLTAHAGENGGPASIWGALNLHAERIGHALTAVEDPELVEMLSKRQIPVEICLSSNMRTGCCQSLSQHPLRNYFEHGLMLTLNTDDPGIFETSMNREFQLAQQTFELSNEHLRELARNSFEASFLPAEKKMEFLNLFDAVSQ